MLKSFKRDVQITSRHTQFFLISFSNNVRTITSHHVQFTSKIFQYKCAHNVTSPAVYF